MRYFIGTYVELSEFSRSISVEDNSHCAKSPGFKVSNILKKL